MIDLEFDEYVKKFQKLHPVEIPIEFVNFFEDFQEINKLEDEFCIPHSKLVEYGLCNEMNPLDENYVQNVDYIEKRIKIKYIDKYRSEFVLTRRAFKLLLMRTPVTTKYCEYILLFERLSSHYIDLQRKFHGGTKYISLN
jgi:hypothetical protein